MIHVKSPNEKSPTSKSPRTHVPALWASTLQGPNLAQLNCPLPMPSNFVFSPFCNVGLYTLGVFVH